MDNDYWEDVCTSNFTFSTDVFNIELTRIFWRQIAS